MHLESTFRRQKLDQNCLNDIMVSFGDTSLGETYNCHLTFDIISLRKAIHSKR